MLTSVKQNSVKYNRKDQEHQISLKQNKGALKGIFADDIANLAPKAAIAEWQKGDENPYYKLQAIDYPIKANGFNYQESFFESFLNGLKEYPYPGSKFGHELSYAKRDKTHFILIGGMLQKRGKGKGTVFFKNYIPPETEDGSNETFIKECKTGMIEFSLVAYTKDELTETRDGTTVWNVVEYLRGGRNDAVGRNEGAMEQKVSKKENAQNIIRSSVANAKRLIAAGKVTKTGRWNPDAAFENRILGPDNDWEKYKKWHFIEDTSAEPETKARFKYIYGDGKNVSLPGLRAVASRAGQQGLTELSNIASGMIDDIQEKENSGGAGDNNNLKEHTMADKNELLASLKDFKHNNITLPEIAEVMGESGLLITAAHTNALEIVEALKQAGIENPVEEIKAMKEKIAADEAAVLSAKLDAAFKDNQQVRLYADKIWNTLDGNFEDRIKAIQEDEIAKKLAAETADYRKQPIGVVEPTKDKKNNEKPAPVDGISHMTI